jgi:DNA-binding winged helix-turn-helix (wHTH) protein/KaiC/GvpD/RAD55 family RecA-like ATPase
MHKKTLIYEFGKFRIDPKQRLLMCNGETITLTPKAFDTLMLLVQNSGRVMEKDKMMKALWPESFVEEGNLTQNIFILRKTLGDDQFGNRCIETIPKTGYQFVAPVKEIDASVPERESRSNEAGGGPAMAERSLETEAPALIEKQPAETAAQEYWSRHSPFRGLQAFEPEDSELFFGRDPEIQELLSRLRHSPVLTIVGDSGTGKSSLVRAGLIPALGQGNSRQNGAATEIWRVALFRPSNSPFDYLADVLPSQLAPDLRLKERSEFIADCRDKFPAGRDALRNAITALVNVADLTMEQAERTRVLLVVDHFEELFTLTHDPKIRRQYIDALLAASHMDGAIPVHLVLVLRSDFYSHCLEHEGLNRCLAANLYKVPQMTALQLRESIEKRLAMASAKAEPGLIDSILEDVGTEPAKLALLEYALSQLWEKCGGFGRTLTHRAYKEVGRLRGPLGRHAGHVYQGILEENRKKLAQKIFLELIQTGEGMQDTRRRVAKEHLFYLGDPQQIELLLADLATSRLITTGSDGDHSFAEVSHEMLLREWDSLREWIRENREDLQWERRLYQAAKDWHLLRREDAALLRGTLLQQGEQWLLRHPRANALLRDFLQASIAARAEAVPKHRHAQASNAARQETAGTDFRWGSTAWPGALLIAFGTTLFGKK